MKLAVAKPLTAPSGGTGGPLEDATNLWFSASHGYSAYYHRYVSHVDWNKPVGLMFWFHGDGGYEFKNPEDPYYLAGPDGVVAQARKHNAVLIVPATPDDAAGRWTWWKWGSKTSNPQYAKELFTHITSQYNVDMYRVWLCGFSGGAEFLSLYLLRHWGNEMGIKGGGCLMIGGGTKPPVADDFPASYKDNWVWEWRVGELDTGKNADGTTAGDGFDAVAAAKGGEQWYRERGWKTTLEIVPGKGHLMPQFYGELVRRSLDSNPVTALGLAVARAAYFEGRKVKEIWHMGRCIYNAFKPRVFTVRLDPGGWFSSPSWNTGSVTGDNTLVQFIAGSGLVLAANATYTRTDGATSGLSASGAAVPAGELVPRGTWLTGTPGTYVFTELAPTGARKPVEVMPATPSYGDASDWLRGKLTEYGLDYTTVTELPFDIDTGKATNMGSMFFKFSSLTTAPPMDTSQVTNMQNMFARCAALTTVPALDTSRAVNMYQMFWNCSSLTDGNVALTVKRKGANTSNMINDSGLTREPFLTIE